MDLQTKYAEYTSILSKLRDATKRENDILQEKVRTLQKILADTDKGDASENAELQSNRNNLDMALREAHLNELQLTAIEHAMDADYESTGLVQEGSIVELQCLTKSDPNIKTVFKLVEANLGSASKYGLLPSDSAVGAQIIGRAAGDEVIVTTRSTQHKYKILQVY